MIQDMRKWWKTKHIKSLSYQPKINEAGEAMNKSIKKIVQKMIITYRN